MLRPCENHSKLNDYGYAQSSMVDVKGNGKRDVYHNGPLSGGLSLKAIFREKKPGPAVIR